MVIYKYLILLFVYVCFQYGQPIEISGSTKLDLKEGSPCVTKDTVRNMTGTCITLFKCRSAGQASIDTKAGYDHNWPPVFVCSYKENADPIVCCPDCLLDNKESLKGKVAMENGNLYSDKGPKAWKKCIEYYSTLPYRGRRRVQWNSPYWDNRNECIEFGIKAREYGYGGYLAKPAEFPHMALLGFGAERDSAQWLCGGSIISEKYILSAAHCASAAKLGNVSFAALGILKRTDLKDYWRIYKIKTIIQHPEYNPPSKYHDIMLLETANEINFGKFVLPACLDTGKGENHTLSATGWGRQSARGALDNDLQVMQLHRYNNSLCSELFPPHRLFTSGYNATIQMCYGREDKIVDTCEGDSGGPLQYSFQEGYHHIMGITSFGKDCGIPGNAGMYTRVRYYVPWIESIVWKDE